MFIKTIKNQNMDNRNNKDSNCDHENNKDNQNKIKCINCNTTHYFNYENFIKIIKDNNNNNNNNSLLIITEKKYNQSKYDLYETITDALISLSSCNIDSITLCVDSPITVYRDGDEMLTLHLKVTKLIKNSTTKYQLIMTFKPAIESTLHYSSLEKYSFFTGTSTTQEKILYNFKENHLPQPTKIDFKKKCVIVTMDVDVLTNCCIESVIEAIINSG